MYIWMYVPYKSLYSPQSVWQFPGISYSVKAQTKLTCDNQHLRAADRTAQLRRCSWAGHRKRERERDKLRANERK